MKLLFDSKAGLVFRLLLIASFLTLPSIMWAALGDNPASVLSDQARMKGALHSVDKQAYVVHEITMSSGSKVREFVSPAGAVFGVAWEGQTPPDLQHLLGAYYQQAQQAVAQNASEQKPRLRGAPVVVSTPGLVYSQSGHMRSFRGQAYIPQLVPQGVMASAIQ